MNQKLIEKCLTVEKAAFYRQEKVEAVIRIALEECAKIAAGVENCALNQLKQEGIELSEIRHQQGRGLAATTIRQRIEKLLTKQ